MALAETEMAFRLIGSTLIGMLIGFARRRMPAGIRTFSLICLGSTIFTLVSISDAFVNPDQGRIMAQIVSGIGFLGLGVIWKQGIGKPSGLTTAAAMWVTASVGVLAGLGMWFETVVAAILILLVLFSKKSLTDAKLEQE